MRIEKKKLADIKRCYCTSNQRMDNKNNIIFASEDPNIGCFMFYGKEFENKKTLWSNPGGCMSFVQIPGKDHEFLAVQEFYLKVSPSLAKIVWGRIVDGNVELKDVLYLPYIHRFDIYHKNGVNYFIGATIASSKENKDDWRVPGKIYVGELPDNLDQGLKVEVLVDGLYRNHGYCKDLSGIGGYFGSDQGIFKVNPPLDRNGTWEIEVMMQGNISEIAVIDIDGDGEQEIMTIEPFHGNIIKIYKKIDGKYTAVYEYENKIDFAHTLVGGYLRGKPTFIAGVRREDAELFYVQFIDGRFITKVIEKGVGPANIMLVNEEDRDLILAANHSANEAAIYIVSDE